MRESCSGVAWVCPTYEVLGSTVKSILHSQSYFCPSKTNLVVGTAFFGHLVPPSSRHYSLHQDPPSRATALRYLDGRHSKSNSQRKATSRHTPPKTITEPVPRQNSTPMLLPQLPIQAHGGWRGQDNDEINQPLHLQTMPSARATDENAAQASTLTELDGAAQAGGRMRTPLSIRLFGRPEYRHRRCMIQLGPALLAMLAGATFDFLGLAMFCG